MSTAVLPLLVMLLVGVGLLLGLRWGRARERRRAGGTNSQAFAAGFRAGHLEGWRDCHAARELAAESVLSAPGTPQPSAGAHRPTPPAPTVRREVQPSVQPRPGSARGVLALMAVVLMAGLAFGDRLLVWWGAAGVALCIMWALRQNTFALLALIAAALIALAVWRLNRSKPAAGEPAPVREPVDHG